MVEGKSHLRLCRNMGHENRPGVIQAVVWWQEKTNVNSLTRVGRGARQDSNLWQAGGGAKRVMCAQGS
jgi:hypothetical protein